MIKEADHQGGRVMHPTALPAFLEMYCNLHVARTVNFWYLIPSTHCKIFP